MADVERLENLIEEIREKIEQNEKLLEQERAECSALAEKCLREKGNLTDEQVFLSSEKVNKRINMIARLEKWLEKLEQ
ncbi:MAG: hypothetical protein IJD14_06040 [Christensenellaceae bacterium]|nr:hypothetical protein [Christensenellaceae bacterium]